ncbi:MAG: hypothetical protein MZV64_43540 [Ignavibacteriales bacterium]|nr:hypothetical protein [Ignavibacteriales bacterium]
MTCSQRQTISPQSASRGDAPRPARRRPGRRTRAFAASARLEVRLRPQVRPSPRSSRPPSAAMAGAAVRPGRFDADEIDPAAAGGRSPRRRNRPNMSSPPGPTSLGRMPAYAVDERGRRRAPARAATASALSRAATSRVEARSRLSSTDSALGPRMMCPSRVGVMWMPRPGSSRGGTG